MKKRLIKHGIAVIGIAVMAFFSIASGKSTPAVKTPDPVENTASTPAATATGNVITANDGNFGEQVKIPAKDFEALGLVFSEVKIDSTSGDIFTFQNLLKEAQKLKADAIINVVIDKRTERVLNGTVYKPQETWYGSALAIRYTTVLGQDVILNSSHQYTSAKNTTGTTVTEGFVRLANDGVFGEEVLIPAKNFESAGLVFTEVQYEINVSNGLLTGDAFTYQALLKEADKLKAHGIVNVTIDKRIERKGNIRQDRWFASALAIRYTTTVTSSANINGSEKVKGKD